MCATHARVSLCAKLACVICIAGPSVRRLVGSIGVFGMYLKYGDVNYQGQIAIFPQSNGYKYTDRLSFCPF